MKINYVLVVLFSGLALVHSIAAQANDNPHELTSTKPIMACDSCHIAKPELTTKDLLITKNHPIDSNAFGKDGVEMCVSCHDKDDGHKVGLKLDFQAPADLPLGPKNKLTCLTCHYTHGSLSSNKPQASVSFMDKLTNSERLNKSFLLRRNNANGDLCLSCHEVKEGSS